MLSRQFIRKHLTSFAILIFIATYSTLVLSKSSLIYNKDGSLRQFGIGILLAIISYFIVLYYISLPRMDF